jgi:hypothetical protein
VQRIRAVLLCLVLLAGLTMTPRVTASATSSLTLEATYRTVAGGWAKVERWHDRSSGFIEADFPADGRLDQTGQRERFFGGDARPAMGRYLLSYAPGWKRNPKRTPVLLVPGAYETADFAWANPAEGPIGCGATPCPTTGMMQDLVEAGHRVFGVTFPHIVGNNYNHAEQIRNAIANIKDATGAAKVDVVAWSMGALAARMYVSGVRKAWGTPYGDDVRKLVLLGGPNKGWDYTFRHGTYPAISTYAECGGGIIGGTAAIWQNCFGVLYSHPELTAYITSSGDFFPGVRQMLRRWDRRYPVNPGNPDGLTTYYGGTGFFGQSYGIEHAVSQGSLISAVRTAGVPSAVRTYVMCGKSRDIPSWNNERDGRSDGTILLASCANTGGIGTVAGRIKLRLNHLELTWRTAAVDQVRTWLE